MFKPIMVLPRSKSSFRWATILCLCAIITSHHPALALADSINKALAAAYKNNPQLLAEQARLRATDENLAQAQSGYRPDIDLNAEIGSQRVRSKPGQLTDGDTSPYGYSVTLSQPLFRGFRTMNGIRAAKADIAAGRANLRNTVQLVLNDAVTAYMNVVRERAILRLRQNNLGVLTKQQQATFDRFSEGEVTQTDLSQAKARRSRALSDVSLAKANLISSLAEFKRVIGYQPSRLGFPGSIAKHLPKRLPDAIAVGLDEHPQIEAARFVVKSARYNLDVIKGERLPEVNLELQYQHNFDESPITNESNVGSVFARTRVPLYQAGSVYSRIRQAKQIILQRRAETEQARLLVKASIISSWGQVNAARAQIIANQTAVQANRTALDGVKEEERLGQRTLLDVLDAEQELLVSQITLTISRRDLVVAEYNLLAAVGRLSVATLPVTTNIYDPEINYQNVDRRWRGGDINHPELDSRSHHLWDDITIIRD